MKKGNLFKRFLAVMTAFVMVFAMGITAFAEDSTTTTNSLTIENNGNTAHTFELYQIFTGDLKDDTLSNIAWGNGITDAGKSALGDAAAKAETLQTEADAEKFADDVQQYLTNPTKSESVATGSSYKFDKLAAGYYLVKDAADTQKDTAGAYTKYVVRVVGTVTAQTKLAVPTVVKKVKDVNDSDGKGQTDWQDSADYDIGDEVPYQITGTMPSNIDKYTTYKYAFTDTMTQGLTYTAKSAKIMIGDTDVTSSFTETITDGADGAKVVTWSCDNLKSDTLKNAGVTLTKDTKVIVTYNCKLNDQAVIGSAGNPNTVYLTFSNNPNKGGEGETGKTPEDTNIVFTYKLVVNKLQDDNSPLAGAEFTLTKLDSEGDRTKKTYTYTLSAGINSTIDNVFTFNGLDDGKYLLEETKTPSGYNTMPAITVTVSAKHDTNSDAPKLTELTARGTYTADANYTSGNITFTPDTTKGSVSTNVINKLGSSLPSTGGRGTMLIYILGAALVAGVAVFKIVTKKKA